MMAYKYSFKTGLWKSLKNVCVVLGVPAVLLLLDNWTEWVPIEWQKWFYPVIGFISYLVKNKIQN